MDDAFVLEQFRDEFDPENTSDSSASFRLVLALSASGANESDGKRPGTTGRNRHAHRTQR